MPLTMISFGKEMYIKKIMGKGETKKFLESLGFVTGALVSVISENGGNMILNIKNTRVALGKELANKIIV